MSGPGIFDLYLWAYDTLGKSTKNYLGRYWAPRQPRQLNRRERLPKQAAEFRLQLLPHYEVLPDYEVNESNELTIHASSIQVFQKNGSANPQNKTTGLDKVFWLEKSNQKRQEKSQLLCCHNAQANPSDQPVWFFTERVKKPEQLADSPLALTTTTNCTSPLTVRLQANIDGYGLLDTYVFHSYGQTPEKKIYLGRYYLPGTAVELYLDTAISAQEFDYFRFAIKALPGTSFSLTSESVVSYAHAYTTCTFSQPPSAQYVTMSTK